jgi:hypothetical protein
MFVIIDKSVQDRSFNGRAPVSAIRDAVTPPLAFADVGDDGWSIVAVHVQLSVFHPHGSTSADKRWGVAVPVHQTVRVPRGLGVL